MCKYNYIALSTSMEFALAEISGNLVTSVVQDHGFKSGDEFIIAGVVWCTRSQSEYFMISRWTVSERRPLQLYWQL